jgi:hypothetical protein
MTDIAVDEAGEDAANAVAGSTPGRMGMADTYTIAAQRASRRAGYLRDARQADVFWLCAVTRT